jgi:hypothetical protein
MVGIATQDPPQARFMPLVIGIPGIVLCLFQLFLEFRARRQPRTGYSSDVRSEFEKAQTEVARIVGRKMDFEVAPDQLQVAASDLPGETRREVILWASFIGLVAGLILFGFWLTIPVFLALFLRCYAKESWRFSLLLSAVTTVLLFLIFAKGLGVILHGGFITEYLLDRFGTG